MLDSISDMKVAIPNADWSTSGDGVRDTLSRMVDYLSEYRAFPLRPRGASFHDAVYNFVDTEPCDNVEDNNNTEPSEPSAIFGLNDDYTLPF